MAEAKAEPGDRLRKVFGLEGKQGGTPATQIRKLELRLSAEKDQAKRSFLEKELEVLRNASGKTF